MPSIVSNMINNYRQSVNRREELAYRRDRDRMADEKWASGEVRARERHDAWKEDREFTKSERSRAEQQRDQWAGLMSQVEASQPGEIIETGLSADGQAGVNRIRQNSGRAGTTVFVKDEEGNLGIGARIDDKEIAAYTLDPNDEKSAQLHIASEDVPKILPFLGNIMEKIKADHPDMSESDIMSLTHGALEADETGRLSAASVEAFAANQERFGSYSEEIERKGLDDRRTSAERVIDGLFLVDKKGQIGAAKPSKMKSRESMEAVYAQGQKERDNGQTNPIRTSQGEMAKAKDNPYMAIRIPKVKRTKIASDMLRTGAMSPDQAANFVETGDWRFSKDQLVQRGLNTRAALARTLKAEQELNKRVGDGKPKPKDWQNFRKVVEADIEYAVRASHPGSKSDFVKDKVAQSVVAMNRAMKELDLDPRSIGDPTYAASVQEATQRFLSFEGDFKSKSMAPFLSTVAGGLDPTDESYMEAVEGLLSISAGKGELKTSRRYLDYVRQAEQALAEQGSGSKLTPDQHLRIIHYMMRQSGQPQPTN